MKKYLLLSLLLAPAWGYVDEVDCERAMATYEINLCARQEVEAADEVLETYLAKAKERYSEEPKIIESLGRSQTAWVSYRKAHCDAVYQVWAGGTIRGVMFNGCMSQLAKQRTHKIWQDYLTYVDATPPLLPEPK